MSNTKSDREWRIINAATEVLRDMGIALHYEVIGKIVRATGWNWPDAKPTDEELARALRRNYSHRGQSAYPPVTILRESPGVWKYYAVPVYVTPASWREYQRLLASRA